MYKLSRFHFLLLIFEEQALNNNKFNNNNNIILNNNNIFKGAYTGLFAPFFSTGDLSTKEIQIIIIQIIKTF